MGPEVTANAPTGTVAESAVPVLRFRDLSKHFGGEKALDGVDFTVERGEVHGLLGQNGLGLVE